MNEIKISYTEDGMFGQDPDNREGVNIAGSFAKFDEMLLAELHSEYPNAEIRISNGIQDKLEVWPDDDIERNVEEILHHIWESWEWIVKEEYQKDW